MTNVFDEQEKKVTNALFKTYSIIFKARASTNVENTQIATIQWAEVYFQKFSDFFGSDCTLRMNIFLV